MEKKVNRAGAQRDRSGLDLPGPGEETGETRGDTQDFKQRGLVTARASSQEPGDSSGKGVGGHGDGVTSKIKLFQEPKQQRKD